MSYSVDSLKPKHVWKYFDKIRQIPHGSKDEKALAEAVLSWAKEMGCEAKMDDLMNVVVKIKATPGYENAPAVVIQGHLDMVCEKNSDKEFDFTKDSIVLQRNEDWITADGTTLGADNGIGLAMGLALMEMPEVVHGPVEILCTVDEETGLHGANGLKSDFVDGRMLLNLDSEEDGIFYVGCAGGRDCNTYLPITKEDTNKENPCYSVKVKGLRGGHSGLDIVQNRGNATRLLARAITNASEGMEINLVSIEGGDKHNAIPREANAVVSFSKNDKDKFEKSLNTVLEGLKTEYAAAEPELDMFVEETKMATQMLSGDSTKEALSLVLAIPHGVVAMSRDLKGMVETSTNVARVRTEEKQISILTSSRSSVQSAVDGVIDQIVAVGQLAGANVEPTAGYPGWQPNMDSKLLALAKDVWVKTYNEEPLFTAIHAGLECGIIGEKYDGMDMISFGPTIENPHSPDERLQISTVERCFDFLTKLLKTIANK